MELKIYNSLTKTKEVFKPIEKGRVGIYVCGPTVYDSAHIGHARSAIVFDVIVKYLRAKGFKVNYIRNFTDVDDKIINRANKLGVSCEEITEKYIAEFYSDMDKLNVARADIEPRATHHIEQIIKFIEKLIEKGFAYHIEGDVYYSVEFFKDYGKLSGRKLEDMEAGARVEVDNRKKNPHDFALWKKAKDFEPSWDSPWGKGRPGWHIECSAMSVQYLGESFDIHGGGKDLIFPHHENEIAQSEAVFGKPFANYWLHNGFVNINQEKMSKSLGNFVVIKDILKEYHPETVRLFLLSSHYRSPIDFSNKALEEFNIGLDKIYGLLERAKCEFNLDITSIHNEEKGEYWNKFCEAMDDDFNTAKAIAVLFDLVHHCNRLMNEKNNAFLQEIQSILFDLSIISKTLGISAESFENYFENKKLKILSKESIDLNVIENLIEERLCARKAKDWKKADEIRKKLLDMNIILEDRKEGTIWKPLK